MEPESGWTHPIAEKKLGHQTQQNYNRSNYKMFYKSVIILYTRTEYFPYFENKIKNLNNIIIMMQMIIIIMIIRKIIIYKMNKRKRYILFSFMYSLSCGRAVPLLPAILFWMSEWNFPCTGQYLMIDFQKQKKLMVNF